MKKMHLLNSFVFIALLCSGCALVKPSHIDNNSIVEIDTTQSQEALLAELYASLTCMVGDQSFGPRNNYRDTDAIYRAYGYNTYDAKQAVNIYALKDSFGILFSQKIDLLCPGSIPQEKVQQIIDQLKRDAS